MHNSNSLDMQTVLSVVLFTAWEIRWAIWPRQCIPHQKLLVAQPNTREKRTYVPSKVLSRAYEDSWMVLVIWERRSSRLLKLSSFPIPLGQARRLQRLQLLRKFLQARPLREVLSRAVNQWKLKSHLLMQTPNHSMIWTR